jgi:hypothetical protein
MMSSEENNKNLPPESTPDSGGNRRPFEEAPGPSERPEEQLGDQLGDTADSVTRELRDLQDELLPPAELSSPSAGEPSSAGPVGSTEPAAGMESATPVENSGFVPELPASSPPKRNSGALLPEGTNDDRLLSMLAWLSMVIFQLPVVSIIQLLSENTKNRPFQRHHAITSLLFYVAGVVYEILAIVVYVFLTTVTLGCAGLCLWVILFLPHALALYYAFQAYSGKRVELPYLSEFGRRQGWLE